MTDMIGVCIGIGPGWRELATATAERMEKMTGVPCVVIADDDFPWRFVHPSWLKTRLHEILPQHDSFLVFDADLCPLRHWDPRGLFESLGRPFIAVPEPNGNPAVREECQAWGLGFPDTYINAGLLIYGREHAPVWDATLAHHPHGGRWLEQTALNQSLAAHAVEVCRLPRRFNVLAQGGRLHAPYARATFRDAVNVHTCAMADPAEILAHHQRMIRYVESGRAGRTRLDLLRMLPPGSRGAEIGVFCGDFSRQILETVQPETLFLVDLFQGQVTSGDQDGDHLRTEDMARMGVWLRANFRHRPSVHVEACDSIVWLIDQPAHSLDWVYLDTTHDYQRTLEELRHAAHAVRPGGWICGHDFSRAFPGVVQAVTEFCKETGCPLEIFDGDKLPSFAIRNARAMPPGAIEKPLK